MLEITQRFQVSLGALLSVFIGFANVPSVLACTRAVYWGTDNLVITGRSMDWFSDMSTNLWAFPRGIQRNGEAGPNSIQWTSQYGSVGAAVWDIGIADGLNSRG